MRKRCANCMFSFCFFIFEGCGSSHNAVFSKSDDFFLFFLFCGVRRELFLEILDSLELIKTLIFNCRILNKIRLNPNYP